MYFHIIHKQRLGNNLANAAVAACCISIAVISIPAAEPAPALQTDRQYDTPRTIITLNSHRGFILQPRKPAADGSHPWLWYAPTFINILPDHSNEWLLSRLLDKGFAIVGVDVGESYGNPAGRKTFSEFYDYFLKTYHLDPKVSLLPQSRGGLMLYNWAVENPEKILCIGAIFPVCDPSSYPGLDKAAPAYHMTREQFAAHLAEHNPLDRLEPLARAHIPIFHVQGDSDVIVPLEKNSGPLRDRYVALGGRMDLLIIPGKGHQVDPAFFECEPLLRFLERGGRPDQ
jgi:pimeloyl-ACP methyl ester carboxylesterase